MTTLHFILNPFEIDDIIFYIFDYFLINEKISKILKCSILNKQFNKIGKLERYNLPEIKFVRLLGGNREEFMNSIEILYKDLQVPHVLDRNICKTDVNIVYDILQKKHGYYNIRGELEMVLVKDIIKDLDIWSEEWLGQITSYDLLEKIFIRIYKFLIKFISFSLCSADIKLLKKDKFSILLDQLLIKSCTYNFSKNELFPEIYNSLYYSIDILCYIKIIYHAIKCYST